PALFTHGITLITDVLCLSRSVHSVHRDHHSFPHDALPILICWDDYYGDSSWANPSSINLSNENVQKDAARRLLNLNTWKLYRELDRKSTRLNSSHVSISYAVFCLKKKRKHNTDRVLTPEPL